MKSENANDIFVCSVSKEIKYVDYMCIVTAYSRRHMKALAEFVRKVCKLKREGDDVIPKIEGESSNDWMALDLGNIALHIFMEEAREMYDLESLWSIGPEYDKISKNAEKSSKLDLEEDFQNFLKEMEKNDQQNK